MLSGSTQWRVGQCPNTEVEEARMAEALVGLHRFCSQVRFLGSYPAAQAKATAVPPDASDRAFADARAWVDRVRQGRLG